MSVSINEYLTFDGQFEKQCRENKVLYVDYENSNWFRTNEEGSHIIQKFDGNHTIEEVLENYAAEKHFDREIMIDVMLPFVERAVERKLLLKQNEKHEIASTEPAQYPNELWIHLTNRCNMACPFCYSSSGAYGEYTLAKEDILAFVKEIPVGKRKRIILSGGEPLLYEELLPLVRELKELGFSITMISNGTLGKDKYPELVKYLDTLQFSIDGSKEETHSITRGKGNLEKTLQNIHYAHQLGMENIVVSFTSNKFNIHDLPNMPQFCKDHSINHIHVTRIIPSGRANETIDDLAPQAEVFEQTIHELARNILKVNGLTEMGNKATDLLEFNRSESAKVTYTVSSDPVGKLTEQTKITTCSLANATVSINYDGKAYPCCCLHADELCLGDLKEGVEVIMERGRNLKWSCDVQNSEMKDCFVCKYKYFCGGGCRACARANGDMKAKDFFCDYYISRIEEIMWHSPGYYY